MKVIVLLLAATGSALAQPACTDAFKANRKIQRSLIAVDLLEREASLRVRCQQIFIEGFKCWDKQERITRSKVLLEMSKAHNISKEEGLTCGNSHPMVRSQEAYEESEIARATKAKELMDALNAGEAFRFPGERITPHVPTLGVDAQRVSQLKAEWEALLQAVKEHTHR